MIDVPADGLLRGDDRVVAALSAQGIRTVADVLARAETVRDLPDRANLVLREGGVVLHVKRSRSRGPARAAAGLEAAAGAGVPVPAVALVGRDRRLGSVVGTASLAPARPLDDLLRERALSPPQIDAVLSALASAVAALHEARLHHRDLYLNHVFVDPSSPRPGVVLIDWDRLSRHGGRLGHAVVKDLAAIESSVPAGSLPCLRRARWLGPYLLARGLPVRTLRGPLLRRILRKAARIRRHLPRTPVGAAARPPRHSTE